MVTLKNKQRFYLNLVGAVSNRTGAGCPLNSKVYYKWIYWKNLKRVTSALKD